jgi:Family of unknown function (DUF6682)
MQVSVGDTLTLIRGLLQDKDSSAYRWSDASLVNYLGLAGLELARLRGDAAPVRDSIILTKSETLQDILPADAIALLSIERNKGADGATIGDVVLPVPKADLDRYNRGWHAATGADAISAWARIPEEPTKFYCSPPAHASTDVYLELIYSHKPDPMIYQSFTASDVDAGADTISLAGHGLSTGAAVILPAPSGALPAPLVARTTYYVIAVDGDTIQLAATAADATASTQIDLTDTGSGTNYIDSLLTVAVKYQFQLQMHVAGQALVENKPAARPDEGAKYMALFYMSLGVRPGAQAA